MPIPQLDFRSCAGGEERSVSRPSRIGDRCLVVVGRLSREEAAEGRHVVNVESSVGGADEQVASAWVEGDRAHGMRVRASARWPGACAARQRIDAQVLGVRSRTSTLASLGSTLLSADGLTGRH